MQFYQKKWLNFHIIYKLVICVLLVCPVHLFPSSKEINRNSVNLSNENDRTETATVPAVIETLNSNKINVNEKNGNDKPVPDRNFTVNHRSKRSMESEKSAAAVDDKEYQKSSRQFNIPFMAVPSNWIATFDPTNAVILTQNVPLRIWAIGSVAKFPTFLENVVQRIQSYYSTYKYHDLSRPATHAIINPQYHLHQPINIETMPDDGESTDNFDGIDVTEYDPIDEGSNEFDTETASTLDYYDTTTDINYSNLNDDDTTDDLTETTETNGSIEVFK